mmetsp:Transcript_50126/g.119311  ORF Transcript_50126/g.119311 Transcript_50126/m.119311 type:complete len:357 (+) Transcript_50126:99-1169(+)
MLAALRQLVSCRKRHRLPIDGGAPEFGTLQGDGQTAADEEAQLAAARPWMDAVDVESQHAGPRSVVQPSAVGPPPAGPLSRQSNNRPSTAQGPVLDSLDPTSFQAWHHARTAEEAVACVERSKQAVLKLSASSMSFSATGFSRLADGLVLNTQMLELRLHHCGLDCGNAAAIATALRSNSTLRSLSLECNRVGTLGARSFAETLLVNDELESLTLRQNVICKEGVVRLARALEENYSLRFLDLQCNPAGNTMKAEIQGLLKRNKAPSRIITLVAKREAGSPDISISCINLAGEELLHFVEPAELRCRILRSRIAQALRVPRHRLGLAAPNGQLLGRWMDTATIADCLGLAERHLDP